MKNADGSVTFALRMVVGSAIFLLGIGKLMMGTAKWSGWVRDMFAAQAPWVPLDLITILAWVILVAELVLGVMLLFGWKTRMSFVLAALLIALINVGLLLTMQPMMVAANLGYVILCVMGAHYASKANLWSVD